MLAVFVNGQELAERVVVSATALSSSTKAVAMKTSSCPKIVARPLRSKICGAVTHLFLDCQAWNTDATLGG